MPNKALILPGNGNSPIDAIWYPKAKQYLQELGCTVIAQNMPDANLARATYWLPFIEEKIGDDENAILIGHSSGAIAIMRYLEMHKAKLAILVSAYHTDLGLEDEKVSGYFDDKWNFDAMKENAEHIVIISSRDDPYIDINEPRFLAEKLDCEYHEFKDLGHINTQDIPLLKALLRQHL